MSSAISTEPPSPRSGYGAPGPPAAADSGLQPWHFFVLAALGCATAVTVMARSRGVIAVLLLGVLMLAAALVGLAALRALRPLVAADEDRTPMVGKRTRAALEREKLLTLRTIKELEFDRAMGKLSDADFQEMSTRLRARAARLMKQLDAGASFRGQIEQELAKRIQGTAAAPAAPVCAACSTANDADARFCKTCGTKL